MTNGDIKGVAKFVYKAFAEREIILDVLSTLREVVSSTEISLKNQKHTPDPRKPEKYQVKKLSDDGMKLILSRI